MPLHALPSDVTTVIHDFCGTRELGYSLGCCGKAWRPTDAAWKRLSSRHPLTRLAVQYVSSKYAGWCAALFSARRPNEMARPLAYAFDEEHELSSIDPAPHYVLQIWRGGKLVAIEPREKSYAGAISLYTTRSLLGCLEPRKANTMRTAVLQGASRK